MCMRGIKEADRKTKDLTCNPDKNAEKAKKVIPEGEKISD